jgi:dienelactone hydrolase
MLKVLPQKRINFSKSRARRALHAAVAGITFVISGACMAQAVGYSAPLNTSPNPYVALSPSLNEEVVMVPATLGDEQVYLQTTIFKPPGTGPFPIVVMNHGKALGNPNKQRRDRFIAVSREFVKRGYAVVIPMRKGFAGSTGSYAERVCDMTANAQAQADDLRGALEYIVAQPWADANRIVLAGQSYGGLAAMAFATRDFPGVKGVINFAGGLRIYGGTCQWQSSLIDAFSSFGAQSKIPTLWFYGQNDSHFDPEIASRLHQAYVGAGGQAKLIAYGPFKKDAHGMSGSRDGVKIWWPETEAFLKSMGLPAEETIQIAGDVRPPKSNYAELANVDALPFVGESGREQYRVFLTKSMPRAFAVSTSGSWSWAEDGDDPAEQVLTTCERKSGVPCKLYAVDDVVVWTGS